MDAGHDERRGEGRAGDLVNRVRLLPATLAALLFALLLAACRGPITYPTPGGSPLPSATSALSPTPSPPPPTPTAMSLPPTPTATPTPQPAPTPTVPPPTPVPTPTHPTATPVPQGVERARIVTRLATDQPVIVLSFDCGADRGFAEDILDTLAAYGIRATFGMTGAWAQANPDLVARMLEEGHRLVNHSATHPSFTGRSTGASPLAPERRAEEIRAAEEAVARVSGRLDTLRPYFRPPYGDYDDALLVQLPELGYDTLLLWTVDTLGWRGLAPAAIVQRVLDHAQPGAIVLLHVGAQSTDAAALPALIEALTAEGYRFATVDDVLS